MRVLPQPSAFRSRQGITKPLFHVSTWLYLLNQQNNTKYCHQTLSLKMTFQAGRGGSRLLSQHLGGQDGQITRSRVQDQPGQHGETPSLLKIQKLAGGGGGHL